MSSTSRNAIASSPPPTPALPRYASMTRGLARTSAGAPSAIFSPWSSTVMCSETPMTTFMSCSISTIVIAALVAQLAHERGQLVGLLRVHAGRRLVEQQELRVRRQRAGDLDPPLVAVGEVDRELVVHALGQADVARAPRAPSRGRASPPCGRRGVRMIEPNSPRLHARVLADHHVLDRASWSRTGGCSGTSAPCPRFMIRSGRLPVMFSPSNVDPPDRRLVEAGEHVEERRLAGAVGPDDRDDRLLGHAER